MPGRPEWSAEDILEELTWIEQYGRSRVWAIREKVCESLNVPGTYLLSMCNCPEGPWGYAWICWCCEGGRADTWKRAMDYLESHMYSGLHK